MIFEITTDGCLHPLTNGIELSHWMCSHGPFGWSVITFPCRMRGRIFVFHACILGDNCDTLFYCEKFGHHFLLDYAYVHWGCILDSHLFHYSNKIPSFNVGVHQANKEFYVGWEVSQISNFAWDFSFFNAMV